jgi:polar amino acid transport system substrate-binding protein
VARKYKDCLLVRGIGPDKKGSMNLRKILLLLIILLVPSHMFAAEKTVALATLTDFKPFCFRKPHSTEILEEVIPPGSDSSQLQGYSWEVVRRSFHEMGYTIRLFVVPWERALHYLNIGRVDIVFPANKTNTRQKLYFFSEEPVDRMNMVIYLPGDSNLQQSGLESFAGLRIGCVRGWAYGKKWEMNKGIKKESMDTILQGFTAIDKKRLAGVVGYERAYDYALKEKGIERKYKKFGPFDVVNEYLMAKKDRPGVRLFLQDFDVGKEHLIQKGMFTGPDGR